MAGRDSKYIYGSAAEKIKHEQQLDAYSSAANREYYDPYEQNAVLKSKKLARNNARLKKRIMVNMFLVFGMCAVIMFRYAQISQMNYDNNNLSKQYSALQNENAQLTLDIEKARSLQSIREIAENRLNMHSPEKSQIVYISVPKQDVTILAAKQEGKLLEMVRDIGGGLKKFFGGLI